MMHDHNASLFRPLLWGATLAIGFGTLWTLMAAIVIAGIESARQGPEADAYEQLVVTSDGTPLIATTRYDNRSFSTYRDLGGQAKEKPAHVVSGAYMPRVNENSGFFSGRPDWNRRLKVFENEQDPTVIWYFIHNGKREGSGYFVGYERKSNRRIGFIGLSGFQSQPVPIDQHIPVRRSPIVNGSSWSSGEGYRAALPGPRDLPPRVVFVPSINHIQRVDLGTQTVQNIFETPEPIDALGIPALAGYSAENPSKEQPILVRTGPHIHSLNHKYETIRVFTIPNAADRALPVYWYELDNGEAIAAVFRPGETRGHNHVAIEMLYRIAQDGTIRDQTEAVLKNSPLSLYEESRGFAFAWTLPVPTLLLAIETVELMNIDSTSDFKASVSNVVRQFWPSLVALAAFTLVLVVLANRRCRAFGLARRVQRAWAILVLLFGLPAYAGFLLHRRWPTRQPCPRCRAQAPRDRDACAACATPFPAPSPKGIEIFA